MDPITIAAAGWAGLSAVAIAILGALALRGGSTRPRGALAFGLFGILWGAQLLVANATRVIKDADVSTTAWLVTLALLLPLPYLLVEFAIAQAAWPSFRVRLIRGVAAAISLLGALLLVGVPELLFTGVREAAGRVVPMWGPLHVPLVTLPLFGAFGIALLALDAAKRSAPTHRVAGRMATLFIGLSLYVAYAAGNNVAFFAGIVLLGETSGVNLLFVGVFAGLAAIVLWLAAKNVRAARSGLSRSDTLRERWAVAACIVPLTFGALEGGLAAHSGSPFDSVGLWRLAGVAVLAYGIARWRSYDLPDRARTAAANATGATAAVATGAAAYGAGVLATSTAIIPAVAAVIVVVGSILPALGIARRLFGIERQKTIRDAEHARYGQRIDSYRAALEASLARGSLDEDREFLAALRERFSITSDEERVLIHLARGSVIVQRTTHAWDAYERLRLLGEGGSGRSWLARDRARDRLVVLKEPLGRWQQDPKARDAVVREARTAAKVRHPNVVRVEEVVEGNGSPVIVMEYLEGGSLADLLQAKGTLPWADARILLLDVLRGLDGIHQAGIVHRDVKPSNILLDGDGVAKVADFGIAVSRGTGRQTEIFHADAPVAGTLSYMAPEARGGAAPDRRADVYAAAAVLHEMLHAAPPGDATPMLMREDIPPALAAIMRRALSARPEERPASARAFADELAALA